MTSESDVIWGRLGLSAVRAVPLEEPRAPSAEAAVTELRRAGPLGPVELRLRPLPGQQVFTIDAMRLLVDRLQDLLAIRLPFLARSASRSWLRTMRTRTGWSSRTTSSGWRRGS